MRRRSGWATLTDRSPAPVRLHAVERYLRCLLCVLWAVFAVAAVGCASGSERATDGDRPRTTEAPAPTDATSPTTTPADALARGACPEVAPLDEPDEDRPVYDAALTVDPPTGQVAGTVTIRFTPDLPIDVVHLRLWANAPRPSAAGTHARVLDATVDGRPAMVEQEDATLVTLPLDGEHPAGQELEVALDYELVVAGTAPDRVARTGDTMRLGSFLPLLPWVPGTGWALEPATDLFAEATTTPTAVFRVALAVPEGHDVLATGVPAGDGTWIAEAVRDFAASIGHFELASTVVDAPEPVEVTVGVDRAVGEEPQPYLDRVAAALVQFSERFGPYPWPSLTVAITPGLGGGIEMPMHIMQGPDTLGRTTPHEVGHMWFYSLVGNNQGVHPWVDEGLASYAEATFDDTLDELRATPLSSWAAGHIGEPLTYWEDHRDDYYPGVYVQGAVVVADLGDEALVDCALRHYVAEHAYGIATDADLVEALAFVFPHAPDALATAGATPTD